MDTHLDCKDVAISGLLDAMWFGASVAVDQALDGDGDGQGEKGEPGVPGAPGINCWDLNADGVNDPEEDVNGDGVWDALDCEGAAGEAGQAGQSAAGAPGEPGEAGEPGEPGEDGAPGLDCWDLNGNGEPDPNEDVNGDGIWDARDCQGADGEPGADVTGVIARGVIPGPDVPDYPDEYTPDPDDPNAPVWFGIERVTRPDNPGGPPSRGRFIVEVTLPERLDDFGARVDYTKNEIVVLVTVESLRVGGGGGLVADLVAFYEILDLQNPDESGPGLVTLEVYIRQVVTTFATDATFSLVILAP